MKRKLCGLMFACVATALVVGTAQAAERDTPRIESATCAILAGETVWTGLVVGQTNGYAYRVDSTRTSASTNSLTVIGVAQNSAASNSTVRVRAGMFGLKNDGTVTAAHIGANAYASTNNTAYTVSASGSVAVGKIVAVDSDYVWTRVGL